MDALLRQIAALARKIGHDIPLMEVCGTHTVAIFRHGIRGLLPANIRLLSGPGCPVCVTAAADVDRAIAVAKRGDAILATFGDMMRVPGGSGSLGDARAAGADVRIVYSPMDCLALAREHPGRQVVFFATGFETTSPSVAATLQMAEDEGLGNFAIYSVHKTVPPALRVLAAHPEVRVSGFILPGHVSTMIGVRPYRFLAADHGIPSVITGFGAEDIVRSIFMLLAMIAEGRPAVEVQYRGAVREEGNPKAMALLERFFEPVDADWRGIGVLPGSGLSLRQEHRHRDILRRFDLPATAVREQTACRCGDVLIGKIVPTGCPLFGKACTPERPVGACMVSTEGSCAAYFKYGAR